VNSLRPGDDVFGVSDVSCAEFAAASATKLAHKPASPSFADVAGVPVAGLTALQALRDHGAVEPGQKVLINGASGGVGTYAVQIAKVLQAHVTAMCSTRNSIWCDRELSTHVRGRYPELTTDRARSSDRYLAVTRHRCPQIPRSVCPDRVVGALASPLTTMGSEMSLEVVPSQAAARSIVTCSA
jgi:hypothetical protein